MIPLLFASSAAFLIMLAVVSYAFGYTATKQDIEQRSPLYLIGFLAIQILFEPCFLLYGKAILLLFPHLSRATVPERLNLVVAPPLLAWFIVTFVSVLIGRSIKEAQWKRKKEEIQRHTRTKQQKPAANRQARRRRR